MTDLALKAENGGATILLFGASLTVMHLIFPDSMERIWRGQFQLWKFYAVAVPLVIFELAVLWLLRLLAAGAGGAGEVRHVAVMFVDFRNFTGAARVRTPQQVVDRLDGVFAVLVDILDCHHGIVNKFLGDDVLRDPSMRGRH